MNHITINGVALYDGRYELETMDFTTREWGWIKRLTSYMPLTIEEGFRGGDLELYTVFAVIAMVRAGKIERADVTDAYERLLDVPFESTITIELEEAPLATSAQTSSPPSTDSPGPDSMTSSEPSVELPKRTGTIGWDSSASPRTELAS